MRFFIYNINGVTNCATLAEGQDVVYWCDRIWSEAWGFLVGPRA